MNEVQVKHRAGWHWLATFLTASAMLLASVPALAAKEIRIGLINSHGARSSGALAYRNGATLAAAEINAEGGVLGRQIVLVSRDDDGSADEAVRNARSLINADKVEVLTGSMLSNVALAVARTAAATKTVFVVGDALTDAITLDKGNRYTFRLRPSTYMQAAMLAEQAARLPLRRWAIIAPNYEYGQSAVANFKLLLKERRPDVSFVAEQWPALGKMNAAVAVKAIKQANPDAILNVTFGADMEAFAAEGRREDLFSSARVFSMSSSESRDEAISSALNGWTVIGYPSEQLATPEHQRFVEAYVKRFGEQPHLASVFGYSAMLAITAGIRKAGTDNSEKLVLAMRGLSLPTPLGPVMFRALDQQSSMGAFIGTLTQKDGHTVLGSWRYLDGTGYMPADTYVRGRRPAAAMR